MSLGEAAEYLDINIQTLRAYMRDGKIVAVRVGRRKEIHLTRLEEFLKGKTKLEGEENDRPETSK